MWARTMTTLAESWYTRKKDFNERVGSDETPLVVYMPAVCLFVSLTLFAFPPVRKARRPVSRLVRSTKCSRHGVLCHVETNVGRPGASESEETLRS